MNIGIDLGGSHVKIGVVTYNANIIEEFEKDYTIEEKKNLMDVAIKFIVEVIYNLKRKYEFSKVGLGIAGSVSNNVVLRSVNLGLENFDIKTKLQEKTGLIFNIENDAKCAAIAEAKFGVCKDYKNVLFMTIGTGIGGAFIYDGNLIKGSTFAGTEFGHMVLKENGILCNCGKRGCFEKYAGILAFKRRCIERLGLPYEISGMELREQINLRKNDVIDIIDDYLNDLSLGISNLINIFEPDCICLGGGFAKYKDILLNNLKKKIVNSNLLFNKRNEINIKVASFGNDAGVIRCKFALKKHNM